MQVLGDSKVVIQWLKQEGNLQTISTEGWKRRIKELISTFKNIHFQHIFREANGEADQLSKQALTAPKGKISYYTWDGKNAGPTFQVDVF
jgi:ribonuclease HI